MKKLLVGALAICTVAVFCACGGTDADNNDKTSDTQVKDTQVVVEDTQVVESEVAESEVVEDGKVEYCVTVVDEEGTPFVGVMVQMCKDLCVPAVTDGEGVARFSLEEDYYDVKVTTLPEGYTYSGEEEVFHFEEGTLELTITLKPEA